MWSDKSNSNNEHDCCSGDFKELYKQKCHTALPFCWASISELEIQMCINQCRHPDWPPNSLTDGWENVATKARCSCNGSMHWNYGILAATLMTDQIGIFFCRCSMKETEQLSCVLWMQHSIFCKFTKLRLLQVSLPYGIWKNSPHINSQILT